MSNVKCPRSQIERSEAAIQDGKADFGHRTLDVGLERGPVDFVLTVSDLRKSFLSPNGEKIEVLRGVSFSASPCEAVAIMGSSGAGKSTLLHLLGGLEAPDHGRIIAGKFSIDNARPSALAHFRNHRVGFIFQFHHLLPDLTAAENVSLPLMIGREGQREALRRGLKMLKKVGLDERSSHLVGNLSGGEQQRVAVCRALVTRPSLVLADEPTGNLDRGIGDEIAHSLISYAKEGQAVVVVATHSRGVAELCDRILVLRDGRLFNL